MSYKSADQIATMFANGRTGNIKLSHKQSSWLIRQAEYDKQYRNKKAWGAIVDNDNNEIGQWFCSSEHMRNNVFVLEVRLFQTAQQKADESAMIQKQIDGLKLSIEAARQYPNSEFIIGEMEKQIECLTTQIN